MIYLKNIGTYVLKHLGTFIALFAALWLFEQWKGYNNGSKELVSKEILPTQKEVKEIHHYHDAPNIQPVIIQRQIILDTSYRHQAEKETINTGVKIEPGDMKVQSVDPNGKVSEKEYKVPEGATAEITNKGVNIKEAPFYKQLKLYAGAEAGVNQNGLTNISPQLFITSPTGWALNGGYNIMDNSKSIGVSKIIRFKK